MKTSHIWRENALSLLRAERDAAPSTPLLELPLPAMPECRLWLKDESAHPSGSLKHRLARSLLAHHLTAGHIGPATPLFDASSGNTAVSEAWFAARLGLAYFALVPRGTTPAKQELIRRYGGECVPVDANNCCKREAARLAQASDGCFLDQFANAAQVTDWREHNVVSELFAQLRERAVAVPDWFVVGAGTGGTSTCAGRYFQENALATRLLVVDPEDSAFFAHYSRTASACLCTSRVEGIGRPTVEPAFRAQLVDRMQRVPDAASWAAARWLSSRLGQPVGVSTGTNLIGAIELLHQRAAHSVATLICDHGARYAGRLDNDDWLAAEGLRIDPWLAALDGWYASGRWWPPVQPVSISERTFA